MWPGVSVVRAICSMPFTKCASVRRGKTFSRASSAWMPTASNRRGLADSWNIGNVLLYNHRNTMMIDKVVRDYAAEQLPNGNFPACCPAHAVVAAFRNGPCIGRCCCGNNTCFRVTRRCCATMAPRLTHFLDWLKTVSGPSHQAAQSSRLADFRLCRRQPAQRRLQHRHRLPIL